MKPILNTIGKSIKSFVEKFIVDIPEIPDEKREEIAKKIAYYAKEVIVEAASESAAKIAKDQMEKRT